MKPALPVALDRLSRLWSVATVAARDRIPGSALALFVGFLAAYAYLLQGIRLGQLYAFSDYPPYYGYQHLDWFWSTWHFAQIGYPHTYTLYIGYLSVVTLVGGVWAQNLVYLAIVPASFVTFYVFSGRLLRSDVARGFAAGLYAINPVTMGKFVSGSANEFMSYVGIPLVLYFLWDVAEEDSWRAALIAGIVFGATTLIPWTAFWLVAPFACLLLYRVRLERSKTVKLLAAGVVGTVLSLPNIYFILQFSGFLGNSGTLFDILDWTYARASPLAVVRLAGNHGSFAMNQLQYNSELAVTIGFVIPLVAVVAWSRRDLRPFFVVTLAIVAFMWLTKLAVTYPLFERIPVLWSLRNPSKLQFPLVLATSVLFGGGLETLLQSVRGARRERLQRGFVVAVVFVSLVAYMAPAAGAFGLSESRGQDYFIPDDYSTVADDLDGRVLWVPYTFTTQLRLLHTYPDNVGVRPKGSLRGQPNAGYVTDLFTDFVAGDDVRDRLVDLGVKYVVVDSHPQGRYGSTQGPPRIEYRQQAPWVFGDPGRFEAFLEESGGYTKTAETEHLTVYRVEGAERRSGFERLRGINRVVYPTTSEPTPLGDNRLANPQFERGLDGWRARDGDAGTQVTIENDSGGARLLMHTPPGEQHYAIVQEVELEEGNVYRIETDGTGEGSVWLHWRSADGEIVETERVAINRTPVTVRASTASLSFRLKPSGERLTVTDASVVRTTYPPETGFESNTEGIPGSVVDGYDTDFEAGKTVAVNLPGQTDADVHVVDAESAVDADIVYDETYRQGAAVVLPDGEVDDVVPDDANAVTYPGPGDSTVVDYWVVGSFDDTPVTILWTSYDDRWEGPPGSMHFVADGWANGFTDADPTEIRWTGGTQTRTWVVRFWLGSWVAALLALGGIEGRGRLRRSGIPERVRQVKHGLFGRRGLL